MNANRIRGRLQLTAAALLLSVAFSSAAIADTGALRIKVTDGDGNAIAGASVNASTTDSLTAKSGVTDADGGLRLSGLDPSDNYVITVSASGFQSARNEGVLVVSERLFNLPFVLTGAGEALEEIITYGRSDIGQLVDTTSALQSTDVTLDIMDSLPTGRSYQSYLQMAPTTKPTNVESGGNPSSKSGVNYSDIGGTAGSSSDNVYYIDGVNVTDNLTGTFGANFNSEIIQEQQIITGGVPAEYEGGQGLISRVVTKSGGNEFHGSVNYYMQSDSLVADNDNLEDASYSTFDTAITLGGPIIKDKLWFFASYQMKEREEDVIDPVTQSVLRSVTSASDFGFAKLTWQATENDKFVAEFFNDPLDRDGSFTTTVLPNRDSTREQGGDNYKFEYSHAWENVILTAGYNSHEGELTSLAADRSTMNDVAFLDTVVTNADTDLGGRGFDSVTFRDRDELKLEVQWFVDTGMGSHEIKAGYAQVENTYFEEQPYLGDGSRYTSIGNPSAEMITLDTYTGTGAWVGERDIDTADYDIIRAAMESSSDSAYFLGLLDANMSGDIDDMELGALVMDQTSGNPTGDVNVYRISESVAGPKTFKQEADVFYIQDSWSIDDHWTVDLGIRSEEWTHFASDSSTKLFTFDGEIAPRLSVVYDIKGDGASKVWGFFGRYYDPIRTNMTDFAGSITGAVYDEQIYAGNQWLTFRTRGGPAVPDAIIAPTTKTPYTDEFMLGWEHSLTADQSIAVTYTDRVTKDILEDYDMSLYIDPARCGTLCLGTEYFGYDSPPAANFFIATLAGGKREYEGIEVTWRKRRSADSRWFGLASWAYNDAAGNTNSDSNADFQGDVIWLDPRAPNQFGPQPGNIEHLLKFAGSYRWDNGIEIGATYAWNSGTQYSDTWAIYGRHLPIRVDDAYDFGGVSTRWLDDNVIGSNTSDSYGTLNARAKYVMEFGEGYSVELFLDIFNVFDDQAERTAQDLLDGDGVYENGESVAWVLPRRFYLGARMSF